MKLEENSKIILPFSSIIFSGFHVGQQEGLCWVHNFPRFFLKNTNIKKVYIFFSADSIVKLEIDKNGNFSEINIDKKSIDEEIDVLFSRTLSSFDRVINNLECCKNSLKLLVPISNNILKKLLYLRKVDYLFNDCEILKPISDNILKKYSNHQECKKEKIIFYPATIMYRKGQRELAKYLRNDKLDIVNNYKIYFAGGIKEKEYAAETFKILDRKKINYKYLGHLSHSRMIEMYKKSKITMLLSKVDYNPRVLFEGLYFNTSFFVSGGVNFSNEINYFGKILKNKHNLAQELVNFLNINFGNQPMIYAQTQLTENMVYSSIIFRMSYLHRKKHCRF